MIIFNTFNRVEMCIGRVTVYTSDIFCESNISYALHLSYFFNEFETHILFTLLFWFRNLRILILRNSWNNKQTIERRKRSIFLQNKDTVMLLLLSFLQWLWLGYNVTT